MNDLVEASQQGDQAETWALVNEPGTFGISNTRLTHSSTRNFEQYRRVA